MGAKPTEDTAVKPRDELWDRAASPRALTGPVGGQPGLWEGAPCKLTPQERLRRGATKQTRLTLWERTMVPESLGLAVQEQQQFAACYLVSAVGPVG